MFSVETRLERITVARAFTVTTVAPFRVFRLQDIGLRAFYSS
jgi:hypothetical protein